MLAPQSDEEVRPVVEALRRLDPLLDIRWNSRAVRVVTPWDALGVKSDDTWDGRWEVIRYETPGFHADRDYVRITMVTETRREGKYPVMLADGAYAPIGMWLFEYMQFWDRAQTRAAEAMEDLWAEHEQAETIQHNDYTAAHQQGAEKVYREHGGGETLIGRGFGLGTITRLARRLVTSHH